MRCVLFASLTLGVGLATARADLPTTGHVQSFGISQHLAPSSLLDIRSGDTSNIGTPGCVENANTQHIKWRSGTDIYETYVPLDGDGDAELDVSTYPISITCDKPDKKDEIVKVREVKQVLARTDQAGIQRVKFHSGPDVYDVPVPTDGHTYLISPRTFDWKAPELPCWHVTPTGSRTEPPGCGHKMDHVELAVDGRCTINGLASISDPQARDDIYSVNHAAGVQAIGPPSYPWLISCVGLTEEAAPPITVRETADIPGCTPEDNSQHIKWHSGNNTYDMFVPLDGKDHNISLVNKPENWAGPRSQDGLYCTATSKKGSPCTYCFEKMDHMQVMNPGVCGWTDVGGLNYTGGKNVPHRMSQDAGLGDIGIPGYPLSISCDPSEEDTPAPLDNREPEDAPGCTADANSQHVKWHAGSNLYEMFVPLNGRPYNISLSSNFDPSALHCIETSSKGSPCTYCSEKMDHVQIMNAGSCNWKSTTDLNLTAGQRYSYTITQADGLGFIGTPSYPLGIFCRGPGGSSENSGDGSENSLDGRAPDPTTTLLLDHTHLPDHTVPFESTTRPTPPAGAYPLNTPKRFADLEDVLPILREKAKRDDNEDDTDPDSKRGGGGFHAGGGQGNSGATAAVSVPLGVKMIVGVVKGVVGIMG
ncbi:hypothetical protein OHC33_000424 [Knufia fluminis]|uniref:Uncharacterized protein n=1 Tax=Knufia fluminis TaxID=191047 RepID=A0AAN8ICK7_9EURO|nr:hypothetical protein OHC33_000424 [Knufia fluminis]